MRFVAALLLVLVAGTAYAQDAPKKKALTANLKVCSGDPLGSREAGTQKCLLDTRSTADEGKSFTVVIGGEFMFVDAAGIPQTVVHGCYVTGTMRRTVDGKVRYDITLENATPERVSENEVRLHKQTAQAAGTCRFGEVVKVQVGEADKQMWAEIVFQSRD